MLGTVNQKVYLIRGGFRNGKKVTCLIFLWSVPLYVDHKVLKKLIQNMKFKLSVQCLSKPTAKVVCDMGLVMMQATPA